MTPQPPPAGVSESLFAVAARGCFLTLRLRRAPEADPQGDAPGAPRWGLHYLF
jgi:hypothetical protein